MTLFLFPYDNIRNSFNKLYKNEWKNKPIDFRDIAIMCTIGNITNKSHPDDMIENDNYLDYFIIFNYRKAKKHEEEIKNQNLNFEEAVDLVRKSNFAPHFKPKKNDVVKRHPATNRITWIWDNMTENEKKIFEYYIQFLRSSPETWVSQRELESILK